MTSEELKKLLGDQFHVLKWYEALTEYEKEGLAKQIKSFDIDYLSKSFEAAMTSVPINMNDISQLPEDRCVDFNGLSSEKAKNFYDLGLEAISRGEVAAIVLAGGQASRLGADKPKGTLNLGIGLSETDSLFFIQNTRLCRLIQLAKEAYPDSKPSIPWLLMTSQSTKNETDKHVEKVIAETGFNKDDVYIFSQNEIPSFSMEGKFLMKSKCQIATNPDGNGGIYLALRPLLPELEKRGVKYVHVYGVDNILCRVADPHFIGCSIAMEADVSAKTVEKKEPEEAVGNLCLEKGQVRIVEYSEITREMSERRDSTGKLYLRQGSIANHFFTINFLKMMSENALQLPFHAAKKKNSSHRLGDG